jgi:hypothetical protein
MATRLYGVPSTAAPVSPGFGAWTTTAGAVRRSLSLSKSGTAEQRTNVAVTSGSGNNALAFQLVSEPLDGAQTITGTVTIVTRGRELATQDNIGARVRTIKVYSNDGNTLRGTLLALGNHSVTTELGTSLAGYPAANAQALSSVSAQNGDRIVVELGYGMTTTGTTPLYDMSIGGTGTDHANSEGDGTGTIPWVEFSQNLTFIAPADIDLSPVTVTLSLGTVEPTAITGPVATLKASGVIDETTAGTTAATEVLGAITFAASSHVVVVLGHIKDSGAQTHNIFRAAASGLTFTEETGASQAVGDTAAIRILSAPHSAGGSTTITIDSNGQNVYGIFYAIYEVTGHDTADPIGAIAAAAQSATLDGSYSITLNAAPAASSIVLAAITIDTDPGTNTVDPGTGWTEDVDIDSSASFFGVMETQRRTGSTSTTVTWNDIRAGASPTPYSTAAAAVEIKAAAGGAVALSPITVTVSLGTVVPTPTVALSPITVTTSLGTVVPQPSVGLSPITATLGLGTVSPTTPQNVALSPLTLTASLGTLVPTPAAALSPVTLTLSLGTVSARPTVGLSPVTVTLGLADLSPISAAGAVTLSPITVALGLGTVSAQPTVALSPITMTVGLGTVSAQPSVALSPITLTTSLGTVSARPSVGLSPITITLSLGTVSARPTVGLSPITLTLSPAALTPTAVTPGAVALSPITLALGLGAVVPTPTVNLSPITAALTLGSVSPRPTVGLDPVTIGLGLGTINPAAQPVNIQLSPIGLTLGLGTVEAAGPSIGQVTGRLSEPRLGGTVGAGPLSGRIPTPNLEGGL